MKTNLLVVIMCFAAVTALAAKPQTKSWVNKDARFFVQHFERKDHGDQHIIDYDTSGIIGTDDTVGDFGLNWDDGKGGKETSDGVETIDSIYGYFVFTNSYVITWPQTWWPNLVKGTATDSNGDPDPHPPGIIYEQRDQKYTEDWDFGGEEGHNNAEAHTKIVLKFYAGGKGLPKRPSVYQASVSAYSHTQTGVSPPYNTPVYDSIPIASQNITIGDLGPLDPDGILYAKIDDGSTKDITPTVTGVPIYTFGWPVLTKYTLISQVSCPALTDTNLERTSLGVAEVVSLGTLPAETIWNTSAGTLSVGQGGQGSATALYAPHSAGTAKVTATVRKVSLSIDFGVVEPSGVQAAIRQLESFSVGSVGAGMYINVVIQPTTVSFSQIEMMEPGEATTGITGYFTSHTPPTHAGNGADEWHPVSCGNLITSPPNNYFDHANSYGWPIGQSGSYTWPINPIWRVVGDTATHSLSGWTDQIMTLSSDGTVRVDKFGLHVTRHP